MIHLFMVTQDVSCSWQVDKAQGMGSCHSCNLAFCHLVGSILAIGRLHSLYTLPHSAPPDLPAHCVATPLRVVFQGLRLQVHFSFLHVSLSHRMLSRSAPLNLHDIRLHLSQAWLLCLFSLEALRQELPPGHPRTGILPLVGWHSCLSFDMFPLTRSSKMNVGFGFISPASPTSDSSEL